MMLIIRRHKKQQNRNILNLNLIAVHQLSPYVQIGGNKINMSVEVETYQ